MAKTDERPILVTVIGGYLGAGKTTLLNHVLRNADERIAVLVNDFGDINIDADLVESDNGDTISLANGCICCSMVDGFVGALQQILELSPRPARLVIEASGVANPGHVTPYAYGPGLELDGTIVVADAERVRAQLRNEYVADVIEQQLDAADLIVLNKADLVDDVDAVEVAVRVHTDARMVTATMAELPLSVVLGLDGSVADAGEMLAKADDRFVTWSETHDEPLNRSEFEARLGALPESVVRAKGIVRFTDEPNQAAIVHVVGRRVMITAGGEWVSARSQMVFIGPK